MKRYKLLKDLPTFKAGEKFHINQNGSLVANESGVVAYAYNTLGKFPNILEDWFEEIPEDEPWVPVKGDSYYYIDDIGVVCKTWWDNSISGVDQMRYILGNCFKAEEEAKRAVKWLKARKVLMDDTRGFKPKRGELNVYVYYNLDVDGSGRLRTCAGLMSINSPITFASVSDAVKSIKKHKAEWLTYLGVEEEE